MLTPTNHECIISLQGPRAESVLIDCLSEHQASIRRSNGRPSSRSPVTVNGNAISIPNVCLIPYFSSFNIEWELSNNDNLDTSGFNLEEGNTKHEIISIRAGSSGEDGFEFAIPSECSSSFARCILKHPDVIPGGVYAADMLRMEAGLSRSGVDVTAKITPIRASLAWTLDLDKMRQNILFGSKRLESQFSRNPDFRRVGILGDSFFFWWMQDFK